MSGYVEVGHLAIAADVETTVYECEECGSLVLSEVGRQLHTAYHERVAGIVAVREKRRRQREGP